MQAKSALAIGESLRALIKAKLGDVPLDRRNLSPCSPSVEAFLAGQASLSVEDLGTFAQLFETTPAALFAEALGNWTLVVQVKLLEELIPSLQWWQSEVEQWRSGIPPSPREDAMLEGEEEQDEATQMRVLLECISQQHLGGTIAAAQEMAAWHPKGEK